MEVAIYACNYNIPPLSPSSALSMRVRHPQAKSKRKSKEMQWLAAKIIHRGMFLFFRYFPYDGIHPLADR
jgi:hypothetical protein